MNDNVSPGDRLADAVYAFEPVKADAVEAAFKRAHRLSEDVYRKSGRWEPGPVRHTSRRVIAYLCAYAATEEKSYLRRAKEGLAHLLELQQPPGNFLWYHNSHDGWDRLDHCLYDTGIAGRAFLYGAKMTGEERWLEASRRAAEWAMAFPISTNNNYNLFAVWHLAAHYRATGDARCLESAIYKTREGGFPGQLPSGGWPGHNSWIWYHGIILRGMAELLDVLPGNHPFVPELRASLAAGLNRLIREQRKTGQVPPNPGSVEKTHKNVFCLYAALLAEPRFPGIGNLINGMAQFLVREFRGVKRIGKTVWPDPPAAGDASIWQPDLSISRAVPGWGFLPENAFRCWIPGQESVPGEVCYGMEPVYGRSGQPCVEVRVLKGAGHCGFGFRLSEGTVIAGQCYRLSAWMRIHEHPRARGVASMFHVSAYGGPERDSWDPQTDCVISVETPALGCYRPVHVDFRAGTCNYAYFLMHNQAVDEGRPIALFVGDIELRPLLSAIPKLPAWHEHLDADMMGLGVLLGYKRARGRIV